MKGLIYIKDISLAVLWRMDRREIRANLGDICLEFTVVAQVGDDGGLIQDGGCRFGEKRVDLTYMCGGRVQRAR